MPVYRVTHTETIARTYDVIADDLDAVDQIMLSAPPGDLDERSEVTHVHEWLQQMHLAVQINPLDASVHCVRDDQWWRSNGDRIDGKNYEPLGGSR